MPELLLPRPPAEIVAAHYAKAPVKHALDLACGSGRHTLFLTENGFAVDAVDISAVALETLSQQTQERSANILEADLDTFTPEDGVYGLAVMTNYLDRALIERAKTALVSGGIFIIETYMAHPDNEKTDSNPDFLLAEKELQTVFRDWEILEYREFWNETFEKYRMRKQAVAAKKPA